jgi:hypothetical protein
MPDAATSPTIADGASATSTATSTATLTDSGTSPNLGTDTATISAGLLFSDSFDNGYQANWVSEVVTGLADSLPSNGTDGANQWVTLDATASSTDFARIHSKQQFPYPNLSASMELRIDQAPTSTRTVRLDVRQSSDTPNVFYAVGATVGTDGSVTKISLFKKVPDNAGNFTICALNDPNALPISPIAISNWLTIKITISAITISGATQVKLSAYLVPNPAEDVTPVATYVDDCSSALQPTAAGAAPVLNGGCLATQTGLGIQVEKGIVASFDNVMVTSP